MVLKLNEKTSLRSIGLYDDTSLLEIRMKKFYAEMNYYTDTARRYVAVAE